MGCEFQLDFYGYDQGNYNARVKFTVQPPTGKGIVLLNDTTVFIGGDPAGGGTDLDATRLHTCLGCSSHVWLTLSRATTSRCRFAPPARIGADTKYKTFWVRFCGY